MPRKKDVPRWLKQEDISGTEILNLAVVLAEQLFHNLQHLAVGSRYLGCSSKVVNPLGLRV